MHDLGIYFPQKASMQRGTFEFHAQAKAQSVKAAQRYRYYKHFGTR